MSTLPAWCSIIPEYYLVCISYKQEHSPVQPHHSHQNQEIHTDLLLLHNPQTLIKSCKCLDVILAKGPSGESHGAASWHMSLVSCTLWAVSQSFPDSHGLNAILLNTGQLFCKCSSLRVCLMLAWLYSRGASLTGWPQEQCHVLPIVSFIFSVIIRKPGLLYCTLPTGQHWAQCFTCMISFSSPLGCVPLQSLF